jgi:undecaprenyl-diphosphatase
MEILIAILLGAVQGVTEFLPISSSGHLVILKEFFDVEILNTLLFDISVHVATAFAIVVYFWRDIIDLIEDFFKLITGMGSGISKENKILIIAIIIGTIPAGLLGYMFDDYIEQTLHSSVYVALALLAGSALFILAEMVTKQDKELTIKNGFLIGVFQVLALMPGFSRSGSTISGGLMLGLKREAAARFSFLLSLPIFAGAGLKAVLDAGEVGVSSQLVLVTIAGSISAFVVGFYAIRFLMKYLKNNSLIPFVWYRVILAIVILLFL